MSSTKRPFARAVTVLLVGGVVSAGAAIGLLVTSRSGPNGGQLELAAMVKAFNASSNVAINISGAGRAGTLTASFDGQGAYETVVKGTPGGVGDGVMLSVGNGEYTRASQAALYNTMAHGSVPLPLARARLYSKMYSGVWLNMVGAPTVIPSEPAHATGPELMRALKGGAWGQVRLVSTTTVNGVRVKKVVSGLDTWVVDTTTSLPVSLTRHTPHGTISFLFSYGKVANFSAPASSQVPPLPVNTSLSPQNYPLVLDPFAMIYTTLQQVG